tara:strand:+ start:493 stop:711 length:219 start_codon:yes stop_codon:yes gene_type:complete
MNKEEKIQNYLSKKYKKKIISNTKLFIILDIDSFEFVKLIRQIEIILKKKYKPKINLDLLQVSLKQFLKLFK